MYRQSPGRSQRSKGIKVKYVLQICLLLAVCFWLIYQVKHSHDKKKEFDESDAKALHQSGNIDEIPKLGRKDIRPQDGQITSKNEKQHDETIEEDEAVEEEDIKHEEDEPEEKNIEESDDLEQENTDAEVDREEESVNENETQEVDSEDGRGQSQSQIEGESYSDENDRDGDDKSTHEAREENYKADDASSAVTHDAQTGANDSENAHLENSSERVDNVLEEENKENNNAKGGEIDRDDQKSNVTNGGTKVDLSDGSEVGSPPNNTLVERPNRDLTSNISAEVKIENPKLDHDLQAIASEQTNNSVLNVVANMFDSNSTDSAETKVVESRSEDLSSSNNNNNTESLSSEKITTSETSVVVGNKTESSSKKNDETETEKSEYENSESTVVENHEEEFQHDGIDISDTSNAIDEKHVRTDLDTLPEIQIEGTNNDDDVAAE